MTKPPMYYFIHNPKTAGTALVTVLGKQIYFRRFLRLEAKRTKHPQQFLQEVGGLWAQVPARERQTLRMVGGHVAWGLHTAVGDAPRYITVLRDPVERVISEYYYMKQLGFYHQKDIEADRLSLVDYLHHPSTRYLNNLQTRLISGVPYSEGEQVTEAVYEKAVANLQAMVAVGLTERFPESLAVFYHRLGWPRVPIGLRANVNPHRPERARHTEAELNQVAEREQFDLRLYAEAEKIFARHWAEAPEVHAKLTKQISNPSALHRLRVKGISLATRSLNRLLRRNR